MTWWGKRAPGSEIAVGGEGDRELLLGPGDPDWVRLPEALGHGQRKVLRSFVAECPADPKHGCRHLELEGDVWVADCPYHHQFFWYRKPGTSQTQTIEERE